MTRRVARTVANVVILSAGVAAAYVVLTTPPLRAFAGMATRRWLGASLPMFLLAETRRAWVESGLKRSGARPGQPEIARPSPVTRMVNGRGAH